MNQTITGESAAASAARSLPSSSLLATRSAAAQYGALTGYGLEAARRELTTRLLESGYFCPGNTRERLEDGLYYRVDARGRAPAFRALVRKEGLLLLVTFIGVAENQT